MALTIKKFVRKPFNVEAVQVTDDNMAEVAVWCKGKIETEPGGRKFIAVPVRRPLDERQTRAYIRDYVVLGRDTNLKGFKVYIPNAMARHYDEIVEDMQSVLGRMADRGREEERYEEEEIGFAEDVRRESKTAI